MDMKLSKLLKMWGIKSTFYVPVSNRGVRLKPGLSDKELVHLSENFEIGSHTMTHPWSLPTLDRENAKKEIHDSKLVLEEVTHTTVTSFCYPRGLFNNSVIEIVKEARYANARTTENFFLTKGQMLRKGIFKVGCTIQARNRRIMSRDAFLGDAYLVKHPGMVSKLPLFHKWNELAKYLFNQAYLQRGVFHLWGHSWEIELNNDWNRLYDVLSYIGNRKDVEYLTVSEFVERYGR